MSLISVRDLTFYYEGSYDNIFENVSFQLDTNWKLGFVARNGRGKTTFLNLLLGVYEYKGTISTSVKFDYFPFEIKNKNLNTIDIVETIYPEYEFWRICVELTKLNVDNDIFYRPFSTLSNGEQTKVMLAILFSKENHFLLIDEPTNHLDVETKELIKEYFKSKKGFILVSHDRDFLDECVDHTLVINKTNIEVYHGNFSVWWEEKFKKDEYEKAENDRLKKDIGRLRESARRSSEWADYVESTKIGRGRSKSSIEQGIDSRAFIGEKSRRMQQRRKNLEHRQEKAIEEKSKLLKNIETVEDLKLFPLMHHKNTLVKLENLKVCYPGKEIQVPDFKIDQGERVLLTGINGCGKSSMIKVLLKELGYEIPISTEGTLEMASKLRISYVSQDTSFLKGSLDNYIQENELDETLFKALLRKLDFEKVQFEKNLEDYSGGQKKKILIAKSLSEKAHLYIWDEPLNYIDVFSRMQIENLILKFKPTMLMVEHDKAFLNHIATKIIPFRDNL